MPLLKHLFQKWVVLIVLTVILMTGCEQPTKPTSDATLPKVRWRVENQTTGAIIDINGSASYAPKPGETIRITVIAEDPEGIHRISLKGHFNHECRTPDGSLAQNVSQATFPLDQILSPNPEGQVLTTIFLIDTFSVTSQCRPGFELRRITGTISGRGENYFSGVTEEFISILAVP